MRSIGGVPERAPILEAGVLFAPLAVLTLAVMSGAPMVPVAASLAVLAMLVAGHRVLLRWESLVGGLLIVLMLVPIRRYRLPVELPFELEPYRLAVALVAVAWISSLLIDPRVRLRSTGFELPLLLFGAAALGSYLVNGARIDALAVDSRVVKELTFLASFILVVYLIASVVKTQGAIDFLLSVLVASGAAIAVFAVAEARTGFNPFNHLGAIPFFEPVQLLDEQRRAGRFRAYGPAQHPIALGAALVLLLPLSVYLARRRGERRWWIACLFLTLGALATMSRTSILMVIVAGIVLLWLRPREIKRLWPALLPFLVVVHFAMPGTLGGLKDSFFPEGGLLADQSTSKGQRGQGRVADLGPAMEEFMERPLLGQGYGSRIPDGPLRNAQILDDQWLVSLLETGIVGVLALIILFATSVRRLARAAKEKAESRTGWLYTALAASIGSFAVGMFTYDAFSFVQVTFLAFILIGLSAAALSLSDGAESNGSSS